MGPRGRLPPLAHERQHTSRLLAMGCVSSSSSPNGAHETCKKAYKTSKEIPISDLAMQVQNLTAEQLNAKDNDHGWAAFDYLALCEPTMQSLGPAASLLLDGGADPYTDALFEASAIGKCVKYRNHSVLGRFLEHSDAAAWDKFMKKLSARTVCDKMSAVGEGLWVLVDEKRKGKTNLHIEGNPIGTDRHGVALLISYEDGASEGAVKPERVTILPQLHSEMKDVISEKLTESTKDVDKDAMLEMLKTCEETDRVIKGMWKSSCGAVLLTGI